MAVTNAKKTHVNPVYAGYMADPFVWKVNDTYYAIGTGSADAGGQALGKAFTVLQSPDFYDWQFAANALLRPDPALGNNFWAPEVAYHDGRFYLYYSVGHGDKQHQLRVAASNSPQGPYRDLGVTLVDPTKCPFAIDAHPFQDVDEQWYLFYARDFLDLADGRAAGADDASGRRGNRGVARAVGLAAVSAKPLDVRKGLGLAHAGRPVC